MQPAPDPDQWTPDLHLVFQADPVSVQRSLRQMLGLAPLASLSAEDRGVAELVLAEVLNNVAEHAYGDSGGTVSVSLAQDQAGIRCRVVDQGRAMPGEELPQGHLPGEPDTPLADLPEGGFGWHLIHSLCADLAYKRVDGQNWLGFVLPTGGQGPSVGGHHC
jgi:serine/threonine-protein kinase RsbW